MKETLLYQDGKACERYREFCRSCPARKRARVEEATPLTQFDTDHEAAWLRDELQAAGVDPAEIDEAVEAHRKGMAALLRWEENDFDRERYESRMRLFNC